MRLRLRRCGWKRLAGFAGGPFAFWGRWRRAFDAKFAKGAKFRKGKRGLAKEVWLVEGLGGRVEELG